MDVVTLRPRESGGVGGRRPAEGGRLASDRPSSARRAPSPRSRGAKGNGGGLRDLPLQSYQSQADAATNGVRPILSAQLSADRGDVKLHGVLGDPEPRRDRLVRQSFSERIQHLGLARGQCLQRRFTARTRCKHDGIRIQPRRPRLSQRQRLGHHLDAAALEHRPDARAFLISPDQHNSHSVRAFAGGRCDLLSLSAADDADRDRLPDTIPA